MSTGFAFSFKVDGSCVVYAETRSEAAEILTESLFGLNDIDLEDTQIDGVTFELEGLA